MGQGDVQQPRRLARVVVEQLVEIPHAEEHERVRVVRLGGEVLAHQRGVILRLDDALLGGQAKPRSVARAGRAEGVSTRLNCRTESNILWSSTAPGTTSGSTAMRPRGNPVQLRNCPATVTRLAQRATSGKSEYRPDLRAPWARRDSQPSREGRPEVVAPPPGRASFRSIRPQACIPLAGAEVGVARSSLRACRAVLLRPYGPGERHDHARHHARR